MESLPTLQLQVLRAICSEYKQKMLEPSIAVISVYSNYIVRYSWCEFKYFSNINGVKFIAKKISGFQLLNTQ